MWCASCQADVAGEVSTDAKSLLCTTCGSEVSSLRAPGKLPDTQGARELLERWNTEEMLDPYQPGRRTRLPDEGTSESVEDVSPKQDTSHTGRKVRTDTAHVEPVASDGADAANDATADAAAAPEREPRVARRPSQRKFRVDAGHEASAAKQQTAHAPHAPRDVAAAHGSRFDASHTMAPTPHFNIDSAFDKRRRPGKGESLWGQLLAYAGVGVLTVGTGLVVWGYFGGPDSYTPTGWLLATAGQMLLFLGVVTLISGGMEQTTHEVTQRIEHLGEHLLRIERHTAGQALRGPHFDVREEAGQSSRQTADVAEAS